MNNRREVRIIPTHLLKYAVSRTLNIRTLDRSGLARYYVYVPRDAGNGDGFRAFDPDTRLCLAVGGLKILAERYLFANLKRP